MFRTPAYHSWLASLPHTGCFRCHFVQLRLSTLPLEVEVVSRSVASSNSIISQNQSQAAIVRYIQLIWATLAEYHCCLFASEHIIDIIILICHEADFNYIGKHAMPNHTIQLRDVTDSDLPIFYEHQCDPVAIHMAAFTFCDPQDRAAFDAHWSKIRANPSIYIRTILADGQIVGNIVSFMLFGEREVGYWIARKHWGKGIATAALAQFIEDVVTTRPLYAHAAKDNIGSIRVLEKCGFVITGYNTDFSNARNIEIEEAILELK